MEQVHGIAGDLPWTPTYRQVNAYRGVRGAHGRPFHRDRGAAALQGNDGSASAALVYAGELSEGVPADGYFDFIVPAEKLLMN